MSDYLTKTEANYIRTIENKDELIKSLNKSVAKHKRLAEEAKNANFEELKNLREQVSDLKQGNEMLQAKLTAREEAAPAEFSDEELSQILVEHGKDRHTIEGKFRVHGHVIAMVFNHFRKGKEKIHVDNLHSEFVLPNAKNGKLRFKKVALGNGDYMIERLVEKK